jgi:hypothetical protein
MSRSGRRASRSNHRLRGAIVVLLALMSWGCDGREQDVPRPQLPAPSVARPAEISKTRPADRGRMIYLSGESPSGRPITARIGDGPPLAATTLACAQCHGGDGRGRPEGGVTPSDITWVNLTRPYGVAHAEGRRHPAYTAALFGRAVTMGWDPAGQTLSAAMPRYQMSPEDLNDLIGYIQQIGSAAVRGVSESAIRIGVALPGATPEGGSSAAIVKALSTYADSINRSGGVFRRRIELVTLGPDRGDDHEIFAALGGFTPDGDDWSHRLESDGVPLIRVYPPPAEGRTMERPNSFALISGHAGQVRALARFVAEGRTGKDTRTAIIHGDGPCASALAHDVAATLRAAGMKHETLKLGASGEAAALLERLKAGRADVVLLAGPVDLDLIETLVGTVAARSPPLTVLCPATLGGRWIGAPPRDLAGRLIVAAPVPSWLGADGAAASAVAHLLVEGLKGAGRDLDQEAIVKALERSTTDDPSQLLRVTFGPGRRVGVRGARILRLGPGARTYEPVGPLIDPGPTADDWPVGLSSP